MPVNNQSLVIPKIEYNSTKQRKSPKSNSKMNNLETTSFSTEVPIKLTTSKTNFKDKVVNYTTTEAPLIVDINGNTFYPIYYIFIVCGIALILLLLLYVIYHFYQKEQLRRLRLQLMPVYNFDPTESDNWESNLLEEEFISLRAKDRMKASYNTISTSL